MCVKTSLCLPFQSLCFLFPLFIYFFFVALDRTSSTMLKESSESRYSWLVPDLREKTFNVSLLNRMLAVDFSQMTFIRLRKLLSSPSFLRIKKIMNGNWVLSNAFSASFVMIMWFSSFIPLVWRIALLSSFILNQS